MLARVNRVRVSRAELSEFLDECNKLEPDLRGFEGHAFAAARLHPRDFDKVSALMFRMEALARLVAQAGAPGWTLPPQSDGAVFTEEAVFAAAAVEPLVQQGNRVAFNRSRFLKRVLLLAEVEAEVQ